MKSYYKKLAVTALAAAMIMPVAACSKKEVIEETETRSGMIISDKTPWYEGRKICVDFGVDKSRDIDYLFSNYVGSDDNYVFVSSTGCYDNPNSIYIEDGDEINHISVADRKTGETIKIIDCVRILDKGYFVVSCAYRKGILELVANKFDKERDKMVYTLFEYDPINEKFLSEREVDEGYAQRQILDFGKYKIDLCVEMDEQGISYYSVYITPDKGDEKKVDIKEEGRSLWSTELALPLDNKTLLLVAFDGSVNIYYKVNLEAGTYTKADPKEFDWLDLYESSMAFNGSDGNVYYSDGTSILRYDTDKKDKKEVLNYSWCNAGESLSSYGVADISGDSVLLADHSVPKGEFGFYKIDHVETEMNLFDLHKAKNPHIGKKVLELYAPYGWVDEVIFSKTNEFNNTNDKYYIVITDRYTKEYKFEDSDDPDATSLASIKASSKMDNKLAMDIINGNGPDIFLMNADIPFSYKDHLVDLTPYIGELSKDKYFTNVVDLAKQDGKIYIMPICVSAHGIVTDAKNAGKSGKGFTTEEYEKFLKETLNGKDIVEGTSQPFYFVSLFNAMKSRFIKDGKADFTSDDFKTIADFVKDNVIAKAPPVKMPDPDDENNEEDAYDPYAIVPAEYTSFSSYWGYFEDMERVNSANAVLLGLPSPDGAGPVAAKPVTVAVSAHSADAEACVEFVKMLLTDETQYGIAMNGDLPLNREAFKKAGYQAVDYFNSVSIFPSYFGGVGGQTPKNRIKFTKEHIDQLEQTILSCTTMGGSDPDIERILVEEMPAYFTGQKSFEETAKVAQDRVQKVLDERR